MHQGTSYVNFNMHPENSEMENAQGRQFITQKHVKIDPILSSHF